MMAAESEHTRYDGPLPAGQFVQGIKYLFVLPAERAEVTRAISEQYQLMMPVAQILATRGFCPDDSLRAFLFGDIVHDVPHPSRMHDAQRAVERIERAIKAGEKILIFGDYDVDGITSTSLMLACVLPLGANINFFLPNRARDGYGLSVSVVERAKKNGYTLIVTVDNGISAHAAAEAAHKAGIDLIITDHHRPKDAMPLAYAIVDPQRPDCTYPHKGLPGVGVMFKVMCLLYERLGRTMPEKAYELLLLGTIADVVPLVDENRHWVRYGLSKVHDGRSFALQKLLDNASFSKSRVSSLDIGFTVAPQINALGRIDDPRDAVKFLISSDREVVERVAGTLWEMNTARKEIEGKIVAEVEHAILEKKINLDHERIIIACGSNWPPGVIGLVAGRLMHNYGRPAIMFHQQKSGLLKGSARSIREFNIFDELVLCQDILTNFGGHSFAAGLALPADKLPIFKERLEAAAAARLTPFQLVQKVYIDAEVDLSEVTAHLLRDVQHLEPFGHQNPQPLFLIRNVFLTGKPMLLKEKHVKCMVFSGGMIKPVMFFNRPELYAFLCHWQDKPLHLAAHVTVNEWAGRKNIELQGIDVACDTAQATMH